MILLRFFKQQNWWYVLSCILFLSLFNYYGKFSLGWEFFFATAFLISYSLKFAEKQNLNLIDFLKLFFYFIYITLCILEPNSGDRDTINNSFPSFIFFLYCYSILYKYKQEMEEQNKNIRKPYLFIIIGIQLILLLGIGVWAVTQKVEADKQKSLALQAQRIAAESDHKAAQAKESILTAQNECVKQKLNADQAKAEALKYQQLYEETLKRKK
jgi:hypothetical protein